MSCQPFHPTGAGSAPRRRSPRRESICDGAYGAGKPCAELSHCLCLSALPQPGRHDPSRALCSRLAPELGTRHHARLTSVCGSVGVRDHTHAHEHTRAWAHTHSPLQPSDTPAPAARLPRGTAPRPIPCLRVSRSRRVKRKEFLPPLSGCSSLTSVSTITPESSPPPQVSP